MKKYYTQLMKKLHSNSESKFNKEFAEKIKEAEKNGSSTYIDGDNVYQIVIVLDCCFVGDKESDEITEIEQDPNHPDHRILSWVEGTGKISPIKKKKTNTPKQKTSNDKKKETKTSKIKTVKSKKKKS